MVEESTRRNLAAIIRLIKARHARRVLLRAAAVVLAVCLVGGWWLWFRPLLPLLVAIAAPQVDEELPQELGDALRLSLTADIAMLRSVHTISLREIDSVSSDPEAITRAVGADEIISAKIEPDGLGCRVELARTSARTGDRKEVTFDVVPVSANAITETASHYLLDLYRERRRITARPSGAEYLEYSRVWRRFREPGADLPGVLMDLARARKRPPVLVEVYAFEISIARYLYQSTLDDDYLEHAQQVMSEALAAAPDDTRVLLAGVDIALNYDLDLARRLLTRAEKLAPHHPYLWRYQSLLLEKDGDIEGAIRVIESSLQDRKSWSQYLALSDAEMKAGKVDSAREHLYIATELSSGNEWVLSRLADLELAAGNLQSAKDIYLKLMRPGVYRPKYIVNLCTANLLLGRYEEAADGFETVIRRGYNNPIVLLNLADTYFLMQDERSGAAYQSLIDATENAREPLIIAYRAQALASTNRTTEALSCIEKALAAEPYSPEVLYTAAIVYSQLGDRQKAKELAEQAADRGMGDVWFKLPWFEGLMQ
jgi:serine/threonine-protein kinase